MSLDLADIPDLSFSLDQVPLGVQVVDWLGLAASTIPQVSPAYPNDIYAVLAGLQAWDRTDPVKPQVLQSDGQHALRVRIVNPSGGGIANMTQLSYALSVNADNTINWTGPDASIGTSMWDGTQPTRLTATATGMYLVYSNVRFGKVGADPTNNEYQFDSGTYWQVNGSNILFDSIINNYVNFQVTGNPTTLHFAATNSLMVAQLTNYVPLNAGDYVEVLQSVGFSAALDTGFHASKFSMTQIA